MKKKVGMLLLCLLLVGCGEKTIKCNKNIINSSTITVNQNIELNYKKDSINKQRIIMHYITSDNIKDIKATLDNQYSDYKNIKGINYYFEDTDDGFNFIIEVDTKKIDKNIKEELEIVNDNYALAKQNLKKNGYTCE